MSETVAKSEGVDEFFEPGSFLLEETGDVGEPMGLDNIKFGAGDVKVTDHEDMLAKGEVADMAAETGEKFHLVELSLLVTSAIGNINVDNGEAIKLDCETATFFRGLGGCRRFGEVVKEILFSELLGSVIFNSFRHKV
jgi:hypothetical protein